MLADKACQRWLNRRSSWSEEDSFEPRQYQVVEIPEAESRRFVVRHHYSGSMPAARFHHGLVEVVSGRLVGVAVASVPVSVKTLTNVFPTLQPYRESVELGRFVLLDEIPANAETWMLSRVFRSLRDRGVRGVVSFADPMPRVTSTGAVVLCGHWGTIYQAAGAGENYTGRGTARTLTLLPDGTVLSARSAQKVRAQEQGHSYVERRLVGLGAAPRQGEPPAQWLRDSLDRVGAQRVRHAGPHRYVFRLGASARERNRIPLGVPHGLPYPKTLDPVPAQAVSPGM